MSVRARSLPSGFPPPPAVQDFLYTGQSCEARSELWIDSRPQPETAAVFPFRLIPCKSPLFENGYEKGASTCKSEAPTAISGQVIRRTAGTIKFCR